MKPSLFSSLQTPQKAQGEKFSLTHKLEIPKRIDEVKKDIETLEQIANKIKSQTTPVFLDKLDKEERDAISRSQQLARQASADLTKNITLLEDIIQNEQALITSRQQEEALDRSSKWRSFWLRIGTTASTFIVAILLLNGALWVGLKVPRILTPNEPPTSTQQTHLNELIKANNETVSSVKTTLPKKESSDKSIVSKDIPLPATPDKKTP